MNKQPLISVIVPTCKRSDMLTRAVDSILNQTWQNIEIIVVNDNVPNSDYDMSTRESLSKYEDNSKVKIISTTGLTGGGKARNTV